MGDKNNKPKKVKSKKVKVEYDVDNKMKKKGGKGFKKENVIAVAILLIVELIYYYFATPTINIHTGEFWVWLAVTLVALTVCTINFSGDNKKIDGIKQVYGNRTSLSKYTIIAAIVCIVILVVGSIISSPVFMSSKYAGLIQIEDGIFTEDIVSEDINDIALMDTETAIIIGDRAIGQLSDVVSQYEVSDSYSTIDFNGRPMKVAPLEYAGFIKFMNNKSKGIPGYVMVDPVKNEAKYIELDNSIKYSPSASFNYNLRRHVKLKYPTYDFNGYYFELDNEGNPFYICPVLKPNAGLFGAKDVKGVVVCDPCSGDTEYFDISSVPNWIDRVYDGDLACDRYNWYGTYSGGFINSIFGNKGCKVTTDDYGYKVMGNDVWVYTGVTSVNGDESNIGFVLMNLRTAESKYYSIAGAEEHSAMSSAEGQVQHLGYDASFPSLINIQGVPTYVMVLKDNAGLVKMYALVNVEKYNIVATATTQKDALATYKKLLAENGIIADAKEIMDDIPSRRITVADIKYINMEGETYVYITDNNQNVYKQNFAEDESLIFIQTKDVITVYYEEDESNINILISYE